MNDMFGINHFYDAIYSVLSGLNNICTLTQDYASLRPELLRCGALPLWAMLAKLTI